MRGYFQATTASPTGFRPWNFGMQGLGRVSHIERKYVSARMQGLGRLGVNLLAALPSTAQSQVTGIIQYLQQAQTDINATNQTILQGNAAGVDMTDIAAANQANQAQLSTLTDEFTTGYRAMTGTVPPGLSGFGRLGRLRGLGQVDPVSWTTIAGAAAAIAILFSLCYSLSQQTSANNATAQARLTQQTTSASAAAQQQALLSQAATQYAAGNTAAGDQLTALAQQAGTTAVGTAAAAGSAVTASWFTDPNQALIPGLPNWSLLAAAGFVVFLGPDILSTVRKAL